LFRNGKQGVYNVIELRDSVWAIPVTKQGDIVLIRNFRYGVNDWCWEFPAGGIESYYTPEEAGQAELLEEAGGTSSEWQFLIRVSTMNGIGNNYGHFFIAWDVDLAEPQPEETEFIDVKVFSLDDALHLARSGGMNDALSMMALFLAEPHIRQRFPK